jgi:hypothetical protein
MRAAFVDEDMVYAGSCLRNVHGYREEQLCRRGVQRYVRLLWLSRVVGVGGMRRSVPSSGGGAYISWRRSTHEESSRATTKLRI